MEPLERSRNTNKCCFFLSRGQKELENLASQWEDPKNNVWKLGTVIYCDWPTLKKREKRVLLNMYQEKRSVYGLFARYVVPPEDMHEGYTVANLPALWLKISQRPVFQVTDFC